MNWQDVDPARHPFNREEALDVVREVVSSPDPEAGRPRGLWSDNSVAQGLAERYGTWAFGWFSSWQGYPDSGAVIRELPPSGVSDGDLETQARRYTSALLQWRDWLEELAACFARLAPPSGGDEAEVLRHRERGAAPLVTLVVAKTDAGELWRGELSQALTWYLESTGMPRDRAEELADDLVEAEFESWVAPDDATVARVAEALGKPDA
ncbi:hypothetical protein [Streptomyces sp. NPDC058385]|uniref:hypothetical protein n=1 Tax=Streptomyces sp. NPDC058385 TaxID=3346473 RepID=UPI0036469DBE